MKKGWLTIILVLYIGYALLFYRRGEQPSQPISPMNDQKAESLGVLDKLKIYAEILSADPKTGDLVNNKEQPILQEKIDASSIAPKVKEPEKPYVAFAASATNNIPPPPPKKLSDTEKMNFIQNKVFNVLYNVLHTTQGRELVEKLLLSPPANAGSNEAEDNPYRNNSKLDILIGEGEPAGCGDIVTVQYVIRLVSGQEVENTYKAGKPATFQLGDQKVIKGLEYAIIGMKKDGRRRLVIPPKLAYDKAKFSQGLVANNEFVTLDVELIDIKPSIDNWQQKINIFQDYAKRKDHPILCSSPVYFKYKISTTDEKIIAQSDRPVHFILGSSEVPAAINRAFSGISDQSKRVVLIPSSLLYNKKISFISPKVKLPPKGMLILEIDTNVSIAD